MKKTWTYHNLQAQQYCEVGRQLTGPESGSGAYIHTWHQQGETRWYQTGYLTLHFPLPAPFPPSFSRPSREGQSPPHPPWWGRGRSTPGHSSSTGGHRAELSFCCHPEATSGVSQHSASSFLGASWPSRSWAYTPTWSPCPTFSKRAKVGLGGASFYPIHLQRDPVNTPLSLMWGPADNTYTHLALVPHLNKDNAC